MDQELADAAALTRWQRFSVWNDVMASSSTYDVMPEFELRQSMRFYMKKTPAKFHLGPIWNNGALGFLKRSLQPEEQQQE